MKETKGTNEVKELSFAEQMKIASGETETEIEKAEKLLAETRENVKIWKEQRIEYYVEREYEYAKKEIERKIKEGDVTKTKKGKTRVVIYRGFPEIGTFSEEINSKLLEIEKSVSILKDKNADSNWFAHKIGLWREGYRGLKYEFDFIMCPSKADDYIIFKKLCKGNVKFGEKLIEKLKVDGIKFEGVTLHKRLKLKTLRSKCLPCNEYCRWWEMKFSFEI